MARKATISKEVILENALNMLIRDGYSSVNIKTLAAEIGCSTQPLVWHFENMEGLRHALAEYAKEYAKKKAEAKSKNASDAFENMGRAYVRMAIKEPNLFKFLYLGESPIDSPYKIRETPKEIDSGDMIAGISAETGLSPDQAARVMRNTIIYSHGITTMVATGVFKASEKEIMSMIRYASEGFVRIEKEAANG